MAGKVVRMKEKPRRIVEIEQMSGKVVEWDKIVYLNCFSQMSRRIVKELLNLKKYREN